MNYTQDQLNEKIAKHKLYLDNDPKGERLDLQGAYLQGADLQGADLRGANLQGAALGVKKPIARMLKLLGACEESVQWVEQQKTTKISDLLKTAKKKNPGWLNWLEDRGVLVR